MHPTISQAQPPLEFIPPAFNPLVMQVVRQVLPVWQRLRTPLRDIQAENVELLVELYRQFQEGKIRLFMAIRHPNVNDPYAMAHLIWRLVPQVAREQGISLQSPIHAHFIYDRGIPLWAGQFVGWLFPQLGGTPIQRGKVDRLGLRSARELFANGQFPMVAAPEGATNGHNEIVSPLEPGIAQMGFWCVEDLLKEGRTEEVLMVPMGIEYRYIQENWDALEKLLSQMEVDCGLSADGGSSEFSLLNSQLESSAQNSLYRRLIRLGEHLLSLMEKFYQRFYHQTLPIDGAGDLGTRLSALLDVALKVAEQYFNLQPKGSAIDRCRRLEQAGWDYIYREDMKNLETLSSVERGLADRIAEEANFRIWHMRLVESFVAVTGQYVREKPTFERFAETTLLVWATITRLKGGNSSRRPNLGNQRVQMTVGEPISISQRWDTYQSSRRAAVAGLTKDLQIALEKMIS